MPRTRAGIRCGMLWGALRGDEARAIRAFSHWHAGVGSPLGGGLRCFEASGGLFGAKRRSALRSVRSSRRGGGRSSGPPANAKYVFEIAIRGRAVIDIEKSVAKAELARAHCRGARVDQSTRGCGLAPARGRQRACSERRITAGISKTHVWAPLRATASAPPLAPARALLIAGT